MNRYLTLFSCFCFVLFSLAVSLQESYVENGGQDIFYINNVFASWDHCINDEKTAKAKTENIAQNLMVSFFF